MCGIYGYFGKIKTGQNELVAKIVEELVKASQVRGKDSFGCSLWIDENTHAAYKSKGTPTTVFKRFDRRNHIKKAIIEKDVKVFIGHNRKASIGSIEKINAQPFIKNDMALFHNGTCPEIFDEMNPDDVEAMESETDTEAILLQIDRNGLADVLKNIKCYSLIGLDLKSGKIWTARDRHRPFVIFDTRELLGCRIFASKKAIGQEAMKAAGLTDEQIAEIKSYATKQHHLYIGTWKNSRLYNNGDYLPMDESERNREDCEIPENWENPSSLKKEVKGLSNKERQNA